MTTTGETSLDFTTEGASSQPGMNLIVVMTSFVTNSNSTGQVWAIYADNSDAPEIIVKNLNKPIGICLDFNNDYMYVVEQSNPDGVGAVYQYSVSWDSKEMDMTKPATIYEGPEPTDCDVDQYGNVYIVDATEQRIIGISLANLKIGNYEYFIMYSAKLAEITTVAALDVDDEFNLYYINGKVVADSGLISRVPTTLSETNNAVAEVLVSDNEIGWGMTLTEANLFYTVSKKGLYAVSVTNPGTPLLITELQTAKGVCYADGYVYVADINTASIYKVKDELVADEAPKSYVSLSNPYAVECINTAVMMGVYASLVLLTF
jgi:hypothetical protein